MRLRPCIDIHDGKVKQIVGSTLRDASEAGLTQNYVASHDAAWFADLYRQKNLPGGHIILLNSTADTEHYEADRQQALAALQAYPGGMQIGGGITPATAGEFLRAGASHVIVTSYIFEGDHIDPARLTAMEQAVGREHLVLDLSCRRVRCGRDAAGAADTNSSPAETDTSTTDANVGATTKVDGSAAEQMPSYHVVTNRWQTITRLEISEETLDALASHCDEFLIHAADVEGKRGGIEQDLVTLLGRWQEKSHFPVTYAGGVHSPEDLDLIRNLSQGRMDVTVGSALQIFGGNLDLDALAARASK